MSPELALLTALVGLTITCIAAIGTRSLAGFSPHDLEEVCRRRNVPDRLGDILRHRESVSLAAESVEILAVTVFLAAGACWLWMRPPAGLPGGWLAASWLAGGAMTALFATIWLPRAVAHLWAEPILCLTWPAWKLASSILAPLVVTARFLDAFLHRLAGRPRDIPDEESFEDDIRAIVSEGHREGLLEGDAREMIEGVMELGDLDVSEVMTPRTDMVSIPTHLSWQEALEFVIEVGHTRIPASDKNRDDIVGILYAKDLLPELAKRPDEPVRPWTALLREPYFIPETKPIDVLLQEFQKTRNHMAVVLDEYGGVSGLVTMEDVLEEIVGEIIDEYDKDLVEDIRLLDDGLCEALGKVHVDEVNERLDLDLPDEGDFDTIGGFMFSELGHIPVVGEELVYKNVRITVLEATPRRIERVRIEVLDRTRRDTA